MAHWFHRNPLKATTPATFDLKGQASSGASQKMCSEMRMLRAHLLDLIADPNNDISTVTAQSEKYFALLHGWIDSPDPSTSGASKLRHAIKFRWTNTLLGNTTTDQSDALFEEVSMLFNIALWYTKHSAKLAGKDEPTMEEAKEVHKCLRIAGGIFTFIKDSLVGGLIEQAKKNEDLDSRVLEAYIHLCTAEAQEVTIARAIELKHSASIISSLAYETAKLFTNADCSLASLDQDKVGKWRAYIKFKIEIYYAYAYNYHGDNILAADKCGEAIKCLQESIKHYEKAEEYGREYASTTGAGTTCRPHEHLFYRKLGPVVRRTLEKCNRENGFIYHQKVLAEVPELELKATYGLVAPEEYKLPDPSPQWTPDVYGKFDLTIKQAEDPKAKKNKKEEEKEIPPVKEADIPQSNKDPSTFSGCVVS